jgi:hypothetical protein
MTPAQHLWKRQGWHAAAVAVLVPTTWLLAAPGTTGTTLLGMGAPLWLGLALGLGVAHQSFVWACWRSELGWRALTRRLGETGFTLYRVGFAILALSRIAAFVGLAITDAHQLYVPGVLSWVAAALIAAPGIWGSISVKLYFGFTRATGADHFHERYRTMPFVRKGAFKYVPNSMYTLIIPAFFAGGFLSGSQATFALAAFQFAYIGVHYWCTEKPDMELIYGDRLAELREGRGE